MAGFATATKMTADQEAAARPPAVAGPEPSRGGPVASDPNSMQGRMGSRLSPVAPSPREAAPDKNERDTAAAQSGADEIEALACESIEESQQEESQQEESSQEESQESSSLAEDSSQEESLAEESLAEESVAEESLAEESVAEVSVAEVSVAEEPSQEQRSTEEPLQSRVGESSHEEAQESASSASGVKAGPGEKRKTHVRGPDDAPAVVVPEPPKRQKRGGETGAIASAIALKDGPAPDAKTLNTLFKGTVVTAEAQEGDALEVRAWSEFGGKRGYIPVSSFRPQPGLSLTGEEEDANRELQPYTYEEVMGKPFIGAPKATDVAQGYIGDCFLIAAMGAVAAARPDIIKKMIGPDKPSKNYSVTFFEVQDDGSYKPTTPIKVDAWFPAQNGTFRYALGGEPLTQTKKPLWPMIVEKAYAVWQGGYDKLDRGGSPGDAMEAMAGGPQSFEDPQDYSDLELVDVLRKAKEDGSPICASTHDKLTLDEEKLFVGPNSGPYLADLRREIVADSVELKDAGGRSGRVRDDNKGKLSGSGATGAVDYKAGKITVSWADSKRAPEKASDLSVRFATDSELSANPEIHANHAYIVKGVDKKGLIDVVNPWGCNHPGKVTAAQLKKYFSSLDMVTPPARRKR